MKVLHYIAFILVIVGGLNWGLWGAFDFNLVEKIFGMGTLTSVIYDLVGLSAIYLAVTHPKDCRNCKPDAGATRPMM